MGRAFRTCILLIVFLTLATFSLTQTSSQSVSARATNEILLSGNDWKLGSFEMDEGEKQGAFLPNFDDHAFRAVEVPGEVQRQVGLRGMDLYYQSKSLTLINPQFKSLVYNSTAPHVGRLGKVPTELLF